MRNCELRPNPFAKYIRALHCPTRWTIIRFIGEGKRGTKEIFGFLTANGERLTPSGLYYHLSELRAAGIIEVVGYREEGGGAPEKIWKLKTRTIVIDLLAEESRGCFS